MTEKLEDMVNLRNDLVHTVRKTVWNEKDFSITELKEGDGLTFPKYGQKVKVHYTGRY